MFEASPSLDEVLSHLQIEPRALENAEGVAKSSGVGVLRALNQMGRLSDDQLVEMFHTLTGLPVFVAFESLEESTQSGLSIPFMRTRQLLPIARQSGVIDVAFVDPTDQVARSGVEFTLKDALGTCFVIRPSDWKREFTRLYDVPASLQSQGSSEQAKILEQILDQDRDAPVARRVAALLSDAVEQGASDVHIETRRTGVEIRFRRDGRLERVAEEPKDIAASIIARIKVIADLDLGERRLPQDGRTTMIVGGRSVDIRVSIIPSANGEDAVLRLLDRPSNLTTLEGLGFSARHINSLKSNVEAKDGLVLVAGPTGSGKTTTLYACLQLLRQSARKIVSVEDPIEYQFDHVTQVQASDATGLTFPIALRSFLRHDPDVILIGEIRDADTAKIAVQAALTGHLVLASIHAIDADRITARLVDMGVEKFQLDAALRASFAQRLVRRLCDTCRQRAPVGEDVARLYSRMQLPQPSHVWRAQGCRSCNGAGFKGRIVVAEANTDDADGVLRDGLAKAAAGLTTPNEVVAALDIS